MDEFPIKLTTDAVSKWKMGQPPKTTSRTLMFSTYGAFAAAAGSIWTETGKEVAAILYGLGWGIGVGIVVAFVETALEARKTLEQILASEPRNKMWYRVEVTSAGIAQTWENGESQTFAENQVDSLATNEWGVLLFADDGRMIALPKSHFSQEIYEWLNQTRAMPLSRLRSQKQTKSK